MFKRSALLKQSDLTRYAKALQAAGVEEWKVVVRPDGSHEIIKAASGKAGQIANDWDQK